MTIIRQLLSCSREKFMQLNAAEFRKEITDESGCCEYRGNRCYSWAILAANSVGKPKVRLEYANKIICPGLQ